MGDADITLDQIEEAAKRAGIDLMRWQSANKSNDHITLLDGDIVLGVVSRECTNCLDAKPLMLRILNALAREREGAEQVRPSGTVDLMADCTPEARTRLAFSVHHPSGKLIIDATEIECLAARLGGRVVWGRR